MKSGKKWLVAWSSFIIVCLLLPAVSNAGSISLNARAAILIDVTDGKVLYEHNADLPIAPASVTKILTLYIVFDAMREGRLKPGEQIAVSKKAAGTGGSRMSLRAGQDVPVEEIIKGIAVVSGNDAAVAIAEHMCGSVAEFVRLMNRKARDLGMTNSFFMTPNGLPAKGQLTTARDLGKLSMSYLRHFPESLNIHSMRCYSFNRATRRNANRLLGTCAGVDGLKTGFVCASGYNISATAKRGDTRLLAVVLGASSSSVRATETAKLLEMGFERTCPGCPATGVITADETSIAPGVPPVARRGSGRIASRHKSRATQGNLGTGSVRRSKARESGRTTPTMVLAVKEKQKGQKGVQAKERRQRMNRNTPRLAKTMKIKASTEKTPSKSKSVQGKQAAFLKNENPSVKDASAKQSAKSNEKSAKSGSKKKSRKSNLAHIDAQSKTQTRNSPAPEDKSQTMQKTQPHLRNAKGEKG
ncbi:MAG: D-alanyl-D-alanine carboxypeptidase family protein [Syntrophobacteraceae bacterium]